jgi:hypothetical protein
MRTRWLAATAIVAASTFAVAGVSSGDDTTTTEPTTTITVPVEADTTTTEATTSTSPTTTTITIPTTTSSPPSSSATVAPSSSTTTQAITDGLAVVRLVPVVDDPTTTVLGANHPDCAGLVKDLGVGAATPIAGEVFIKAGPVHVSIGFQAAGFVIPALFDGKEVSHADVCPTPNDTTTSSSTSSTTSSSTTSSTSSSTTSSSIPPVGGLFSIGGAAADCPEDGVPVINIALGNRPDLNGQVGELVIRDSFGDIVATYDLTFIANTTQQFFYPDTTDDVVLTYTLGAESASAEVAFPNEGPCAFTETTTTTPGETTTTTTPGETTTTTPGETTTTVTPGGPGLTVPPLSPGPPQGPGLPATR